MDGRVKLFDEYDNEIIKLVGVTIYVKDDRVNIIRILLSEFYSKGSLYTGGIKKSGNVILNSQTISPKSICSLFDGHVDHWDDDTEVNYQFVENNIRIEFSWHWNDNSLVPNYISLETEE